MIHTFSVLRFRGFSLDLLHLSQTNDFLLREMNYLFKILL